MKRLSKWIAILLAVTFLAIPSGNRAGAQTPTPTPNASTVPAGPELKGLFGTVKTVSAAYVTMQTRVEHGQTGEVEVALTSETKIMTLPVQTASAGYMKTGDRIAVLASFAASKYTALQIVVIPVQPVTKHIQGLVMAVSASQVTLVQKNGKVDVMTLAAGVAAPSLGQFIKAKIEVNPATKDMQLLSYEVADKVPNNLGKNKGKAKGKKEKNGREEKEKGKDTEKLSNLLNDNAYRHIQGLERVIGKAPAQAQGALSGVLEKAQERKADIGDRVEQKKDKDNINGKNQGKGLAKGAAKARQGPSFQQNAALQGTQSAGVQY